MAISNCLFSPTSENPRGFSIPCVLDNFLLNLYNNFQVVSYKCFWRKVAQILVLAEPYSEPNSQSYLARNRRRRGSKDGSDSPMGICKTQLNLYEFKFFEMQISTSPLFFQIECLDLIKSSIFSVKATSPLAFASSPKDSTQFFQTKSLKRCESAHYYCYHSCYSVWGPPPLGPPPSALSPIWGRWPWPATPSSSLP